MSLKRMWLSLRAKLSFAPIVLLIRESKVTCVRGKVPRALLADFSEVAKERRVTDALITVAKGERSTLTFPSRFNDSTKQRFRNIWFSYPD